MATLDCTPLRNATTRLGEVLRDAAADPGNAVIRDAAIHRFEFTYELCGKMLRRYLEAASGAPEEVARMSFPDLIRTGSEQGLLLSGWDAWFDYREARNLTSHTYNEANAIKVMESIPSFLEEAEHLCARLEERGLPDRSGAKA